MHISRKPLTCRLTTLSFSIFKSQSNLTNYLDASLMPDTFLHCMKGNSGCLLLHQKSNADPMEKAIQICRF
ncbi:hypothetical protein ERO13_D05G255620v2 [Gossypium hirsutum]|nr:hypothetical protein ES319_D05G266200v1 [Gossypium barbadense]KAG4147949.1 hypothetical protein ERO13_D05G255620v2 [Gossypium hirsutum]TYI83159.1 hypothetical protein E1A91_D05G272400v1 [Gossypium mustelinum]